VRAGITREAGRNSAAFSRSEPHLLNAEPNEACVMAAAEPINMFYSICGNNKGEWQKNVVEKAEGAAAAGSRKPAGATIAMNR